MKGFLLRLGGFVLIQMIILVGVLSLGSSYATSNQYMYSLRDKYELLKSVPGPRIIFVGGSNLAFGLKSEKVKSEFGLNPINLGLHERLGMNVLLRMVSEQLKSGDVVVISPEFYVLFNDPKCTQSMAVETIKAWPGSRRFIQPDFDFSLDELVPPIPPIRKLGQCVANAVQRLKKGSPIEDEVYKRNSFNQFGDHVTHYERQAKQIPETRVCAINEAAFESHAVDLNEFAASCRLKNVQTYFLFPPVTETSRQAYANRLKEMDRLLEKRLEIPMLYRWEEAVMTDSMFYDSKYHLSEEGALKRTNHICAALASRRVASKPTLIR